MTTQNKKSSVRFAALCIGMMFLVPAFVHAETIQSFDETVAVQPDNSVLVSEMIRYDSEGAVKHGIFRTIHTVSSEGRSMNINDISVTDAVGNPYQYDVQPNGSDVTLKIGDPNLTFTGERTYIIRYTASSAVAHLNDRDEIYWNVTGNSWPFPIEKASVTVSLPDGISRTASACYVGPQGSTERCGIDGGTMFDAGRTLAAGEGFTVAVGFPKGSIAPYAPETWWHRNGIAVCAILLPLLAFVIVFIRWKRYGRDPKGTGVIVPQYDVPDGLTPMEVSIIMHEKNVSKDISAEIIHLATKGYLKIKQTELKVLGLTLAPDYTFTLLKPYTDLPNSFDRILLARMFSDPTAGSSVKVSSLRNEFYTAVPKIFSASREAMLTKQYYKNLPSVNSMGAYVSWLPLLIFGLYIRSMLQDAGITMTPGRSMLAIALSIVTTTVIIVIFQRLMPAKTEKGVAVKEYILGLKEYLQIAEKDRLKFHNAPEKKPELFEHLLPYALALGVENSWAKEFKDIYTAPPSWYEGSYNGAFNAVMLTHALHSFSNNAMTVLGSSPSRGGSGGGGSSGGGGGGGGGGSW